MISLDGRVAMVTGASQGIGRACAVALAKAGAQVALAARNASKLAEVAAEIEAAGGKAMAFEMDLASEDSIKTVTKAVVAQYGKLEILVNNGGITRDNLMLRMKLADWNAVLQTNLTGAFLLTQAASSSMLKARWGRIINISSVVGETGQAGQANYAASKAGLIGLTMSLARELASRNITVNAVAPGYIATPMTDVLNDQQRSAMLTQIPLDRAGTPEDVASAVVFLASDQASYITGHVLDVNGGSLTSNDTTGAGILIGGNFGTAILTDNVAIADCYRMSQPINGAPSTYNAHLADFCRAGDTLPFDFRQGSKFTIANNTIVSYSPTIFDISCWDAPGQGGNNGGCGSAVLNFYDNIVIGYDNPATYPLGSQQGGPGLWYFQEAAPGGSTSGQVIGTINRSNNIYYGIGHNFACPTGYSNEKCVTPDFINQPTANGTSFTQTELDNYNFNLSSGSPADGTGVTYTGVPALDYNGVKRPSSPSIGAVEP